MNNATATATNGFDRIETLIGQVEQEAGPEMLDRVREIVQAMLDYHALGMSRVMELVGQTGGAKTVETLAADELTSSLLLLYDLHPWDLQTRVEKALDKARPYLATHGGSVELLGVYNGVVSLKLQGSCHGCPSSALTMRTTIESAIYAAAPDVLEIAVEGLVASPQERSTAAFVPLEALR